MAWQKLLKQSQKLVSDNAPLILTTIGVTGTITTAYFTGKASFKAAQILGERENLYPTEELTYRDKAEMLWKLYIPAVGTGAITCACIIGANKIGTRRAAAMAAAYTLSERAFDEYKTKVVEKIGQNKELAIRDEIAQDQVNSNPVGKHQVIITGGGDVLCFDRFTGRYFASSMETLKKAQNDVNYMVINHNYASLSDFYDRIGLARTTTSDEVGWNSEELLELIFSTTMSDDNRPCIAIDFSVEPIRNYYKVH